MRGSAPLQKGRPVSRQSIACQSVAETYPFLPNKAYASLKKQSLSFWPCPVTTNLHVRAIMKDMETSISAKKGEELTKPHWNKAVNMLRCTLETSCWDAGGAIRVSFILDQRPAWRNHVSVACRSAKLFWSSATGRKSQCTLTTVPPHTFPNLFLPEELVPFVDTWVVTTCAYCNMRRN